VDHLLSRLGGRDNADLTDEAPSRLRALIEFVKSTRPGVGDQTVSADDPGPFLCELRRYARSVSTSVAARARRRVARGRGLPLARPSLRVEP
jgi:hypothetical protein